MTPILRSLLAALAFGALAFSPGAATAAPAGNGAHRVVIQVDQNDPAVMKLALNNARNVLDYYRDKNEDVAIEIVAYGPGLHMLRADTSPVKDSIKELADVSFPSKVVFTACGNTKQTMEKLEGHDIALVPQATLVQAGVVRIMELEEQGYSYVRP